jgi:hypothetical protein
LPVPIRWNKVDCNHTETCGSWGKMMSLRKIIFVSSIVIEAAIWRGLFYAGSAAAADLADYQSARVSAQTQQSSWSCSLSERIMKGYLLDAGFFATRHWTSTTFVGCAQKGGGFDWDAIAFVPLQNYSTGNEYDLETGYTVVSGDFSTRVGAGYWNIGVSPGTRVLIWDFRIQPSYTFKFSQGVIITPFMKFNDQERSRPGLPHDRDVNVGGGASLAVQLGEYATFAAGAGHFYYVKSFGAGQNVTLVLAELPVNVSFIDGIKTTVGPWSKLTWGNVFGASGNHDFSVSWGLQAAGQW